MRYQNWDVLLFSVKSKVPIQEFKTTCHVVQDSGKAVEGVASILVDSTSRVRRDMANQLDSEYLPTQGTLPLLPTVTSFVPALDQGQNFRLSIHSWEAPEPSRFALNFTKDPGLIMFEARVFIDGRLAGSVSQASHSRQFTDPTSSTKPEQQRFQSLESIGAFEGLCEALRPTNAAKKSVLGDSDDVKPAQNKACKVPDEYQSIRTKAGQTTPATMPEPGISGSVKSRKENAQDSPLPRETASEGHTFTLGASQPSSANNAAGHKRQRVVTPASVKAIDQEDEPKNSIMRKISQGSAGRRALGELPNAL
ncbi:hypothetical protein ACLOAV_008158 [Pseudogymnoascus australis]